MSYNISILNQKTISRRFKLKVEALLYMKKIYYGPTIKRTIAYSYNDDYYLCNSDSITVMFHSNFKTIDTYNLVINIEL